MGTNIIAKVLRILVVEDHVDTRMYLRNYLRELGHSVCTAATMEEGLKKLAQSDTQVLISDIGLPDGTGWELLKRAHLPVTTFAIAMSGFGARADRVYSRTAGFRYHLMKPIDLDEIDRILGEAALVVV